MAAAKGKVDAASSHKSSSRAERLLLGGPRRWKWRVLDRAHAHAVIANQIATTIN
jgi:hypothetical protein